MSKGSFLFAIGVSQLCHRIVQYHGSPPLFNEDHIRYKGAQSALYVDETHCQGDVQWSSRPVVSCQADETASTFQPPPLTLRPLRYR